MYVCMHACICTYACMYMYVCMHVYLCIHACISTYACMHIYTCMHVYLGIHAYMCLRAGTYTCIHENSHIRYTHSQTRVNNHIYTSLIHTYMHTIIQTHNIYTQKLIEKVQSESKNQKSAMSVDT